MLTNRDTYKYYFKKGNEIVYAGIPTGKNTSKK